MAGFLKRHGLALARRRRHSLCCAALLLAFNLFSGLFVAAHADHDCSAHDCSAHECPVCCQIRGAVGNLQLLGASVPQAEPVRLVPAPLRPASIATAAHLLPAQTLRTLHVRFDE